VDEEARAKDLGSSSNRDNLREFAGRLAGLDDFRRDRIEAVCRAVAEERTLKAAEIIHPARLAVTGKMKGAGLFEIMELLGRERTIQRMKGAAS
jgi:glutamyl-tRNA synthetase